jgi:putative oxidoreductase
VNKLPRGANVERSHDVIGGERLRVGMSWLAQNFDFTRGDTIVRLIAGMFLIPHVYSKLVGPGTVGFFKAAGFKPPEFWMYVACVIEASVAVSFLSDMYARYFGLLGAVHLLIAGAAVYRVNKGKWLWNFGGYEYCVFWAACCLAVAIDA